MPSPLASQASIRFYAHYGRNVTLIIVSALLVCAGVAFGIWYSIRKAAEDKPPTKFQDLRVVYSSPGALQNVLIPGTNVQLSYDTTRSELLTASWNIGNVSLITSTQKSSVTVTVPQNAYQASAAVQVESNTGLAPSLDTQDMYAIEPGLFAVAGPGVAGAGGTVTARNQTVLQINVAGLDQSPIAAARFVLELVRLDTHEARPQTILAQSSANDVLSMTFVPSVPGEVSSSDQPVACKWRYRTQHAMTLPGVDHELVRTAPFAFSVSPVQCSGVTTGFKVCALHLTQQVPGLQPHVLASGVPITLEVSFSGNMPADTVAHWTWRSDTSPTVQPLTNVGDLTIKVGYAQATWTNPYQIQSLQGFQVLLQIGEQHTSSSKNTLQPRLTGSFGFGSRLAVWSSLYSGPDNVFLSLAFPTYSATLSVEHVVTLGSQLTGVGLGVSTSLDESPLSFSNLVRDETQEDTFTFRVSADNTEFTGIPLGFESHNQDVGSSKTLYVWAKAVLDGNTLLNVITPHPITFTKTTWRPPTHPLADWALKSLWGNEANQYRVAAWDSTVCSSRFANGRVPSGQYLLGGFASGHAFFVVRHPSTQKYVVCWYNSQDYLLFHFRFVHPTSSFVTSDPNKQLSFLSLADGLYEWDVFGTAPRDTVSGGLYFGVTPPASTCAVGQYQFYVPSSQCGQTTSPVDNQRQYPAFVAESVMTKNASQKWGPEVCGTLGTIGGAYSGFDESLLANT